MRAVFIDTAKTTVIGGNGGNGVNSVYRDKLTRKGHPDGGDGGNGGSVIIRVSTHVHTLTDFRYRHTFKAENGVHGGSKKKKGRNGKDAVIEAPAGTLIYDAKNRRLLKDLVKEEDEFIAARGGSGGKGNRSHKDATQGEEGQELALFLELKLIADAGIIGLPNAGKSTLLSSISKAQPRIAGFPFTTKNPVLGVVEYQETTFKVAEIPGLIEGSHRGRGLGDKFLRHAERTKIFVHLLDLSKSSAEEVLADYMKINKELESYNKKLIQKPQILIGNKIDVKGAGENLRFLKKNLRRDILAVSAKEKIGLDNLIKKIKEKIEDVV